MLSRSKFVFGSLEQLSERVESTLFCVKFNVLNFRVAKTIYSLTKRVLSV